MLTRRVFLGLLACTVLSGCIIDPVGSYHRKQWPWEKRQTMKDFWKHSQEEVAGFDAKHPENKACPVCGHRMEWSEYHRDWWCDYCAAKREVINQGYGDIIKED